MVTVAPTKAEIPEYDNFPHAQTMASFPRAVHDLLGFDQLLNEQERDLAGCDGRCSRGQLNPCQEEQQTVSGTQNQVWLTLQHGESASKVL